MAAARLRSGADQGQTFETDMLRIKRWVYVASIAVVTAFIAFVLMHMSGLAVS
jgi:hypothetical protein